MNDLVLEELTDSILGKFRCEVHVVGNFQVHTKTNKRGPEQL